MDGVVPEKMTVAPHSYNQSPPVECDASGKGSLPLLRSLRKVKCQRMGIKQGIYTPEGQSILLWERTSYFTERDELNQKTRLHKGKHPAKSKTMQGTPGRQVVNHQVIDHKQDQHKAAAHKSAPVSLILCGVYGWSSKLAENHILHVPSRWGVLCVYKHRL